MRVLFAQKKKANEQLGVLIYKPYRWVIRSDRIRCIYLTQLFDDYKPIIAIVSETWLCAAWKCPVYAKLTASHYHLCTTDRTYGKLGGSIGENYKNAVKPLLAKERYTNDGCEKFGRLKVSIVSSRSSRLPRGYSNLQIVAVYIFEWYRARQDSAMYVSVSVAIEDAVIATSSSDHPLIFVAGANVSKFCATYGFKGA